MSKQDLYNQLPIIIRRLFTWGLLSAGLFLVVWYFGGYNLWGRFLQFFLNIFLFPMDIQFEAGTSQSAAFIYTFALENGERGQLVFPANMLHSVIVEVVTLLALWPHKNYKLLLRLAAWCLLFTILYQCFNVGIQLYAIKIGPEAASKYKLFWEETWWYLTVNKVAAFDKFLLRYWAGFPIFMCALTADYFFGKKYRAKAVPKKSARPKK